MTKEVVQTRTQVTTKVLTPMEEKVMRMRRGYRAPENLALEWVGQDNPELKAKLAAIEQRALQMAGAQPSAAKSKIVSALRKHKRS